jgi:hypothetical protein
MPRISRMRECLSKYSTDGYAPHDVTGGRTHPTSAVAAAEGPAGCSRRLRTRSALATLNGPVAGPIFATAVIVIGIGATVAYTASAPSTAGPPPNQLERTLAAELAFGLWSGLGCLAVLLAPRAASSAAYSISMDGQITEPRSVPEPGGVVFAVTCLAWAAPFFIIAWQRRRAWLAVAAVAAATAAAGTAHLFANPPDDFYTPKPPVAFSLRSSRSASWRRSSTPTHLRNLRGWRPEPGP